MKLIAYKNGGLEENWRALHLAICANYTSDKALAEMGVKNLNKSRVQRRKRTVKRKEIDIHEVNRLYEEGYSINKLAHEFRVCNYRISDAIRAAGGTIREKKGRR